MQDTGRLGLVHWDDPEGWYGEGGGRGVFRMGNMCTPMVDACCCMGKPIQYCKVKNNNNYLRIKQTNKNTQKISICCLQETTSG